MEAKGVKPHEKQADSLHGETEAADENVRLIRGVFQELQGPNLPGVRYAVLRLNDEFVHFVTTEQSGTSPLLGLDVFRAFQAGIEERCAVAPSVSEANVIGNYRMLME